MTLHKAIINLQNKRLVIASKQLHLFWAEPFEKVLTILINEKNDPERQLHEYICDTRYSDEAKELNDFIKSIKPELRAYCYQYPTDRQYTCWYFGFVRARIEVYSQKNL